MSDTLKLKYKVGEIEFEAEGPADAVEQQRINFMNAVLPAAVNAMVQTRSVSENKAYIETAPQQSLLEAGHTEAEPVSDAVDYSRVGLSSFLKKYGQLTEQDFTLFAAYFDEKKNRNMCFSIEDVKRYYAEARRSLPKNPSMSLNRLAEKGYIMDAATADEGKSGKCYMLTEAGIAFIETYVPKENSGEKKPRTKVKKSTSNISEMYVSITADDLNTKSYPAVKDLSGAKEQVIMAMYIVTNEGKGEWFAVDDIIHLLVNVFEVPADSDKVNGVFKRNKSMFASEQDANNKKALRRKLLSGAKDFAVDIISVISETRSIRKCCSTSIVRTAFCRKRLSAQEITTCSSLTAVPNGSIFSPMIIPGISNQFCLKVSSGAYSAPPSLTAAPNWYLHGCWRRTPMCRTGFALLRRNSISPTITGITMSRISLWRPMIRFISWR